jgi:hypothetical protein
MKKNVQHFYDVTVIMDMDDYALEDLINDLLGVTDHLYEVQQRSKKSGVVIYRGFVAERELNWINELIMISPYGDGYTIKVRTKN